MGSRPCCGKEGVNRGAWTAEEDRILVDYIKAHGEGRWGSLPKRAGLNRCGKSCRMRWLNYLRPDIKRGNISPDEEELIIRLHRWSLIAGRLPGRTDNEIKNYGNTILGKRAEKDARKPRKYPDRPGHKTTMKLQEDDTVGIPHSIMVKPSVSGEKPGAIVVAGIVLGSDAEVFGDPIPYPPLDTDVPSKSENVEVENYGPATRFLSGFHCGDDADKNTAEDRGMDFDFGEVFLSDLLNTKLSNTQSAVSSEEAMVQTGE